MTPAEKLGRQVVGTIKVRDIKLQGRDMRTGKDTHTGRTFEVIEIRKADGPTVYITNTWYDEQGSKPLQVPEQFVEKFTPTAKQQEGRAG